MKAALLNRPKAMIHISLFPANIFLPVFPAKKKLIGISCNKYFFEGVNR